VLFVSALTGEGLPALLDEMWRRMGEAGAADGAERTKPVFMGAGFRAEPWGEAAGFEDEEE
jgi:hypothetical protein